MKVEDIEFEESCHACPEAYKMLYNGNEVGYLRLRWGYLQLTAGLYTSIFANDRSQTIDVWDHDFNDPFKGMFDDNIELEHFKKLATEKLIEYYDSQSNISF